MLCGAVTLWVCPLLFKCNATWKHEGVLCSLSTKTTMNSVYLFHFNSLTCRLSRTGPRRDPISKLTKNQLYRCRSGQEKKNYTNVRSKNTKTQKGRSITKQGMHVILFCTINLIHGVYIPVMYSFLNYPHQCMHHSIWFIWKIT